MILHVWRCPEGHYEQIFAETVYALGTPQLENQRCPTVVATQPYRVCGRTLVHTVQHTTGP